MSTHSAVVPLRTLAKRLPKLNYSKNDRQNLKQLDPENEAKARLKLGRNHGLGSETSSFSEGRR